ncbi:PfkB family carbohydrate kinase [Breoghania sp. L-A4]|uniref:PfkB family carbohydrate kinase n=1 Tax=Breoghania sp. L-A4 TaxID=2304600 RepID=UPI000E3581D4|nr:PfkB family carbohydrate kinase [Breoghania sp. L-A4]AXS41193.1 kinase [Breoghania sp. L-A4]
MTADRNEHTTDDTRRIALIGGIHMDRIATGARDVLPDTSTPGVIAVRPGGVASNVARILARLNSGSATCHVALAGRLGADADGDTLRAALEDLGIDISAIRTSTLATASYLALHHPDGRLAAAVSDTTITEEVTDTDFAPLPGALADAHWWFIDANLSEATLVALCGMAADRVIAADVVSIAKAPRLRSCLARIDLLFANRDEAIALLGDRVGADRSAGGLAQALCAAGGRAVVVTDGANGVAWCRRETSESSAGRMTALPVHVRHVTGAGDALIGGTLSGLLGGFPLDAALARGLATAALTLEGAAISLDAVTKRLDSTTAHAPIAR